MCDFSKQIVIDFLGHINGPLDIYKKEINLYVLIHSYNKIHTGCLLHVQLYSEFWGYGGDLEESVFCAPIYLSMLASNRFLKLTLLMRALCSLTLSHFQESHFVPLTIM